MLEPKNQAVEGDNEGYQANYQGSRFNALAELMEENLGLKDSVDARIPTMEAGNTRIIEGGSHSVARTYKHLIQGKNSVPKGKLIKASNQQSIINQGPAKERQ